MALSSGRGSVYRGTRGSDPRNSPDERRTAHATNSIRSNDGAARLSSEGRGRRQVGIMNRTLNYAKTHNALGFYLLFVAFAELIAYLT